MSLEFQGPVKPPEEPGFLSGLFGGLQTGLTRFATGFSSGASQFGNLATGLAKTGITETGRLLGTTFSRYTSRFINLKTGTGTPQEAVAPDTAPRGGYGSGTLPGQISPMTWVLIAGGVILVILLLKK